MAPLTLISTSSRPTLCHIPVFTSPSLRTLQLCLHPNLDTRPTAFRRFLCPASRSTTRWSSVTPRMESTWQPACCIVETSYQRMCTPLSRPSRLSALFNLLIGAQLVSRLVFASSHHKWFQVEILQRSTVLCKFHD